MKLYKLQMAIANCTIPRQLQALVSKYKIRIIKKLPLGNNLSLVHMESDEHNVFRTHVKNGSLIGITGANS